MAQYHIKADKLRKTYALDMIKTPRVPVKDFPKFDQKNLQNYLTTNNYVEITPQIVLDLMTSCSQLRQRKVIETFFKECFSNVETEIVTKEHDGKKYQVMRVKN